MFDRLFTSEIGFCPRRPYVGSIVTALGVTLELYPAVKITHPLPSVGRLENYHSISGTLSEKMLV